MLLMDFSFFLIIVALAIFFTLLSKLRFNPESKENNSSSPPTSLSLSCPTSPSASSSSLSLSSPPSSSSPKSSLSGNSDHNVFPSFHGPDVRKAFLSHMLKELRNKGIEPFIDNHIERSKSIGPELKRAIKGSKIAIILLSKNYASSSWCLDELVEIMTCRVLGQTVMTIFYEVEPTDVKKQAGHFGKAFKETCQGKTEEKIETWRKALEEVATVAGYHSKNCDNEAAMIEEISANVSKMLNHLTPSCDFERFIGMGTHIEKMRPLLCMESDEMRMIGIWGPPGIGKSTIARFLFHKLSPSFQLKANMVKIKECYPRPCRDDHDAQLQLQNQMLCQMLNQQDLVIPHLGVAKQRLNDKKVLLVLDDVDQVEQLEALARNIHWFGRGSRIIIVTEDVRVLRKHGINDIYTVDPPSDDEALQIFCMYAFRQKHPKDGFRKLAWEMVCHIGKLPLGLKVMGSYFRNMSKQEWKNALPKLWSSLDGQIESILKFSYDALEYAEKDIFLHIACFFVDEKTERVKEYLAKTFPNVSHELDVLAKKSLIYMDNRDEFQKRLDEERGRMHEEHVYMHDLFVKFGRQIVREQSKDPRKREFLVDSKEISEILDDDDTTGSDKVIGIKFDSNGSELNIIEIDSNGSELNISERAFEGMSNLQFLKIEIRDSLHQPHRLSYLSSNLRLLYWPYSPITCFPSNVNMKFLVELYMPNSNLEKLWDGNKSLRNLKRMDLSSSENLTELPDLSTATNLQKLDLKRCSSLVEVPSSIENATDLRFQEVDLSYCSSLVKLPSSIGNLIMNLNYFNLEGCSSLSQIPSSIGNAINLRQLKLSGCSSLVELPSSIGNLRQLNVLSMKGCSKLKVLPVNVNLKSLNYLDLSGCSSLKRFPEISTNIRTLDLSRTAIEEVPSAISSWSRLEQLDMSHCKQLKDFTHDLDGIPEPDTKVQQVSPLVQGFPRLRRLILYGCKELLSLPPLSDSLELLDARNCVSMERLNCSFRNPEIHLNFANCFKLNKEARDLIVQTSNSNIMVLPGKEIPTYFSHRANGDSLIVNLKERSFPSSLIFQACILVVSKNDNEGSYQAYGSIEHSNYDYSDTDDETMYVHCWIKDNQNFLQVPYFGREIYSSLTTEHLYIYKLEADVTSNELLFKFILRTFYDSNDEWEIKSCGVHCVNEEVNEQCRRRRRMKVTRRRK